MSSRVLPEPHVGGLETQFGLPQGVLEILWAVLLEFQEGQLGIELLPASALKFPRAHDPG